MVNYEPINEPCRLCEALPPHEWRIVGSNVEVICMNCGALLDNLPAATVLDISVIEAEVVL